MLSKNTHHFHIPVMGLGFTVDTPVKVAHYGISSVVSIAEDQLLERMRQIICAKENLHFEPIPQGSPDCRARRVRTYLEMLQSIVDRNTVRLKSESFSTGSEIRKYFMMLPSDAEARLLFMRLGELSANERLEAETKLRNCIVPGSIDVNVMTKVDRQNFDAAGNALSQTENDAHSALRGFATSSLSSSIVFSAGLNPRLYSYCSTFPDFLPDADGKLRKKIIIKVSDYRSAMLQGKFLAKKGLWVSEFRIESGLNCGGHAFATEGVLMGPILDEFRRNRESLRAELYTACNAALLETERPVFSEPPEQKVTAQGGIGTADENDFLLKHYNIDGTGWGSPFLLVPEATSLDALTREALAAAEPGDYYLSNASPLGVPFNNFRKSTSEIQRKQRIEKNRPGSPCYKKFLAFDKEFKAEPICTASREYQDLKIKQVKASGLTQEQKDQAVALITEKDCLCEGLAAPAIMAHGEAPEHRLKATAICPGPNLAFFSGTFSLSEMVDHIYGRTSLLNLVPRPNMFVNELNLYVKYLGEEIKKCGVHLSPKQAVYFSGFLKNLFSGIEYYERLLPLVCTARRLRDDMKKNLSEIKKTLSGPLFTIENPVIPA